MNSACDHEERTDYDHESQVIDSRVNDPRGLLNDKEIIQTNYAGESDAKLVVMTLPMMLSDERSERDCNQQNHKWQRHPPVRPCRDETQDQNHLAIGLIAMRSVNETRLCSACFGDRSEKLGRASIFFTIPTVPLAGAPRLRFQLSAETCPERVTELIVNFSCSSFKSRASVAGLQET